MDIDQRIDTLERRLSAVERKSRAWRILALLLLVALVGGAASEGVFDNASWAAAPFRLKEEKDKVTKFEVVEARTLRIVDAKGKEKCLISTRPRGGAAMIIKNKFGKIVIQLYAGGGGYIDVYDVRGKRKFKVD